MRPSMALQATWPNLSQLVRLTNQTLSDPGSGGGIAECDYTIGFNGKVQNRYGVALETWLLGGNTTDYEFRVTLTSGTFSTGSDSVGVWLDNNNDRTWLVKAGGGVPKTAVFLAEIRLAASPFTVLTSASISITSNP